MCVYVWVEVCLCVGGGVCMCGWRCVYVGGGVCIWMEVCVENNCEHLHIFYILTVHYHMLPFYARTPKHIYTYTHTYIYIYTHTYIYILIVHLYSQIIQILIIH